MSRTFAIILQGRREEGKNNCEKGRRQGRIIASEGITPQLFSEMEHIY